MIDERPIFVYKAGLVEETIIFHLLNFHVVLVSTYFLLISELSTLNKALFKQGQGC